MRAIDQDSDDNTTNSIEGKNVDKIVAKGVAKCQAWDQKITEKSSLRISKSSLGHGKAVGFWSGITATEAQTFTYTIGITSDNSTSTKEEGIAIIKNATDWGVEAGGTIPYINVGVVGHYN